MSNVNSYENAIAKLVEENRRLRKSKEYLLGSKLKRLGASVKRGDFVGVINMIRQRRTNKRYNLYVDKKQVIGDNQVAYVRVDAEVTKQITVFMCVIGKYDLPKAPLILYSSCRYVLFTDQKDVKDIGWEIRDIPDWLKGKSPTYINRYIKFHPSEFFDTDYSIYVDGNVTIMGGTLQLLDATKCETGIAMFEHPERDCLYREAEVCAFLGKGNIKKIEEQIQRYRREQMPLNFGMKEATVILCDLHNQNSTKILSAWWDEFIFSESGRDQLALPYVIWKLGYTFEDFGSLGTNIREDNHFIINYHEI